MCVARRAKGDERRANSNSNPPGPGKWDRPGNRETTPDKAVGSLGHLGYLTLTRGGGAACTLGSNDVA